MRFHQKLSGYSVKRKCRHPDVTPATGHTGSCRETSSSEASEEPRQNDKTFVSVTCVNAENRKKKKRRSCDVLAAYQNMMNKLVSSAKTIWYEVLHMTGHWYIRKNNGPKIKLREHHMILFIDFASGGVLLTLGWKYGALQD